MLTLIFSKVLRKIIIMIAYWRHFLCKLCYRVRPVLDKRSLATTFTILFIDVVSRGNPQHSLWLWRWMGPFLSYLFSAFWVLPLYWLSKPLNSLWYQASETSRLNFTSLTSVTCQIWFEGYARQWSVLFLGKPPDTITVNFYTHTRLCFFITRK